MSENAKVNKVVKKTITIGGKKVPYYVCPPGMSGLGVDLNKHFSDEERDEEALIDSIEQIETIEKVLKEDCGFSKSFQKYLEEGETDDALVEDFLTRESYNAIYNENDFNKDLVTLFNN